MARTVLLVVFLTLGARAAIAQDNVAFAQQRFARGVALHDSGDFLGAASEFAASLQLYESPNSRLYLARSYGKLGRLGEAMTEYQRTARESAERANVDPRYASTHAAAAAEMLGLQDRVAYISVKVSPGPRQIAAQVAGRPIPEPALGLPIAVTPGRAEVKVAAPGHRTFESAVVTRAGETASVYVTLVVAVSDADRRAQRLRVFGWATLIGGTVALGAGGVFGLLAQQQYHELVSTCGLTACEPAQPDAVSAGRRWEGLMELSLVAGGVAVLGGGVMLLLGRRGDSSEASTSSASTTGGLRVGWTGRGVTLGGQF